MGKRSVDEIEESERKRRANEWRSFRAKHLLNQRELAAALGISRRCLQQVETAAVTAHYATIKKMRDLQAEYATKYPHAEDVVPPPSKKLNAKTRSLDHLRPWH